MLSNVVVINFDAGQCCFMHPFTIYLNQFYVRIDVQFRVRYIVLPCQVARLKNEVKKTEDENNLLIKEGK